MGTPISVPIPHTHSERVSPVSYDAGHDVDVRSDEEFCHAHATSRRGGVPHAHTHTLSSPFSLSLSLLSLSISLSLSFSLFLFLFLALVLLSLVCLGHACSCWHGRGNVFSYYRMCSLTIECVPVL